MTTITYNAEYVGKQWSNCKTSESRTFSFPKHPKFEKFISKLCFERFARKLNRDLMKKPLWSGTNTHLNDVRMVQTDNMILIEKNTNSESEGIRTYHYRFRLEMTSDTEK